MPLLQERSWCCLYAVSGAAGRDGPRRRRAARRRRQRAPARRDRPSGTTYAWKRIMPLCPLWTGELDAFSHHGGKHVVEGHHADRHPPVAHQHDVPPHPAHGLFLFGVCLGGWFVRERAALFWWVW